MALLHLHPYPFPTVILSSSSSLFSRSLSRSHSLNPQFFRRKTKSSFSACKASWQELAGVLVFSAIPFTAVKAIANSPLGESLQRRMEERKKLAFENSLKFKALAETARKESLWYGEERPRWLGPLPYDYPAYLTGELPGDYGFDIAGLGKDPVAFKKYFNFEILHARWAMLAAIGALVPEILDLLGTFHFVEPVWWRVGYSKLKGDTLDYLGIPGFHLAGSQGVVVIAICQAILMVGPEYARYCGIEALEPLGIYLPGDINYPGGALFDPLNLSKDPVAFEELKVKEIKNGRLAMIAWLGFYSQAALTVSDLKDSLFLCCSVAATCDSLLRCCSSFSASLLLLLLCCRCCFLLAVVAPCSSLLFPARCCSSFSASLLFPARRCCSLLAAAAPC